MRYRDNNFQNYQEKQRYGLVDNFVNKSERQVRREQEARLYNFYSKYLSEKIEKDWWNCLVLRDKQKIESSFYSQEEFFNLQLDLWSNINFFNTWEEWFEDILIKYKPDRVKYRECKLKKLGI